MAWVDDQGHRLWGASAPSSGRPVLAVRDLLEQLSSERPPPPLPIGVTGGARAAITTRLDAVVPVAEVVATARGTAALLPGAGSMVEIGARASRWGALHEDGSGDLVDFALSDLCAAGAGSFLEQQAGRLRLGVHELAHLAASAPRGAAVAGRCAVFAKSDMIHLQQKGTPLDEIAYGLCLALARSFQARLVRGRILVAPVALVGGTSHNAGLVRALREVLELSEDELVVPADAPLASAVGAALLAREGRPMALVDLIEALAPASGPRVSLPRHPPLPAPGAAPPHPEPSGEELGDSGVYLGMDVGSVSTDLALLTPDGRVVDAIYLPTRGRPLEVMGQAIATLVERHGPDLDVLGVGTTGSGRQLAGRFLGADLVRNEITAQLRGATAWFPEVDTVLEIGGQDAKYVHSRDGHIVDFAMNRICAAGTGSFLEEQAERLEVSIRDEFAELALASRLPVDLGRRCTVFMESEMVHALQQGASTEDVAAGLALSVVGNYLDRVVAGRPVGEEVVFQGGTASNRAVVSAFRQVLGRPVRVHPYNRISGAIGAAWLVIDARADGRLGEQTRFRGLLTCQGEVERSFECRHCANRCQVTRFRSGDEAFYFGDACERWSLHGGRDPDGGDGEGALSRREALLLHHAGLDRPPREGLEQVGIPRASLSFSLLPLWTSIIRATGREPVLSPASSPEVLAAGLRNLPADTCLPVKMACGQARQLVDDGVRTLWLPAVHGLPSTDGGADVCAYVQHLPWMVRASVDTEFLSPEVNLDAPVHRALADPRQAAAELGLSRATLERAVQEGLVDTLHLERDLRALGDEVLASATDRIAVIIGKPYNVADPFLNLNLGRHLERIGLPALPMECLPLDEVHLDARWSELPWRLNRDQVRAALLVRRDPRLFPIVVTSFGCGTDGFTTKHLEELLAGRPRLLLEMDEHRAEAGLVTRLEAFADEVEAWILRGGVEPGRTTHTISRPSRRGPRTFLPFFAGHAHAFAGALRHRGREVVLLPPPDDEVLRLGESLSSGRECHPFSLLVGDAARLVQSGEMRDGDTFFFPGTVVPCLLIQYRDGIRMALRRLGAGRVRVDTPTSAEALATYGARGLVRLGRALITTDLLARAVCETRPYARDRAAVDAIHHRALLALERAIERGGVARAAQEGLDALQAIPVDRSVPRPVVGIAGDLYTRINDFASGNLLTRLEELGCEVWPAPFSTDITMFNGRRRLEDAARDGQPARAALAGLVEVVRSTQEEWVHRSFRGRVRDHREPTYEEVLRLARPYVGASASPLVLLNVAKMVDFARNGACGVLNASCFNCMVGSISAALLDRLREDLGGLPMANLVYGGSRGTAQGARLEAFVHQVHRHHSRHRGAPPGSPGPGLHPSTGS